jgi:hypothetical protein
VDTISVGQTPEGLQISPDGSLLAVVVVNGSNKPPASPFYDAVGLVRTYRIENMRLVAAGQARIGAWSQGVVWSADGSRLMVGNMVERNLQVFAVGSDGSLQEQGRPIELPGGSAALRTAER